MAKGKKGGDLVTPDKKKTKKKAMVSRLTGRRKWARYTASQSFTK